jgi:sporulation protein YlmC with PRC-barrel domain
VGREIQLDQLLGKAVRDAHGRRIGRIEEFRVEQRGDEWMVTHYLLGVSGLLERLGVRSVARMLGITLAKRAERRIAWDQLDLSDPKRPVLRGR